MKDSRLIFKPNTIFEPTKLVFSSSDRFKLLFLVRVCDNGFKRDLKKPYLDPEHGSGVSMAAQKPRRRVLHQDT